VNTAILLIHCPDRKGLVASISTFLYEHGANILHADQHQDVRHGLFFMRVEYSLDELDLDRNEFVASFTPIAEKFSIRWRLEYSSHRPAMAIFVSQHLHCLVDLLHRHAIGELAVRIPVVIGNHEDARALTEFHGIEFHHVPVAPETRAAAEARQLAVLNQHEVDVIVLARYMQILSPAFVGQYPERIINVHHSFLPAFVGARPYHAAFDRGVKLIGATSHYVTSELDEGPIIEQDVMRVSHRDQVDDLVQKGRDLERIVLSRAVRWHLEHRVLLYANKTVIFD
jgi:formyltetrahydrofolate deformylase